MKVFLTGATGAIGKFAVPALIEAGHEVTAIGRTEEKAASLRDHGARAVTVSIFDREALEVAVAGHDAVVNLATHIPPMKEMMRLSAWEENNRIRREGSSALVEAVLEARVSRFVQESITFLYADNGAEWINETSPVVKSPITESVEAAEANAARFTGDGRAGVVLRFGAFYGPGSEQTDVFLRTAKRHVGPAAGHPARYLSSIHLADAAAAAVAALDVPAGIYNVVDDEPVTNEEFVKVLGDVAGKRPWLRLPGRLARLGGRKFDLLTRSQRVSNAKLRDASSWRPRYPSVREGFSAIVREERVGAK